MKTKSLQRIILLASGICAVVVILLSQSFYQASGHDLKTKAKDNKEITIQAPSDMAAQGQAVELNHQQQPSLLEELILSDNKQEIVVFIQNTTVNFFKTLFRVIISPNAP